MPWGRMTVPLTEARGKQGTMVEGSEGISMGVINVGIGLKFNHKYLHNFVIHSNSVN